MLHKKALYEFQFHLRGLFFSNIVLMDFVLSESEK
jgi:hypothetical protein